MEHFFVALLITPYLLVGYGVYAYRKHLLATEPIPPSSGAITAAVYDAFTTVGLPQEQFGPAYNLATTGKLYEVLHHSAVSLGKDHQLRTVQDVIDWLSEAPLNG